MDELHCDLEGAALAIYREAGADPSEPPGPHALAESILGRHGLQYARGILGGAKYQRLPDGREWIFCRRGLPPVVECMKIYHELAERHFWGRERSEQIEHLCDQLAYRIRMPQPAFRGLVHLVGPNWRKLAQPWMASQTAGALRYLEVTGTPGVVVTRSSVRIRGERYGWPELETDLRRLVVGRSLPTGVTRSRVRDRADSFVLMAA